MNRKDFETGIIMGLCLPPVPQIPGEPTAYNYNGTILPKLPEWDRGVYPYAIIWYIDGQTTNVYRVLYMSEPMTCKSSGYLNIGMTGSPTNDSEYIGYTHSDGVWEDRLSGGLQGKVLVWTNVDLFYEADAGGGIFMKGSEPVPVYE